MKRRKPGLLPRILLLAPLLALAAIPAASASDLYRLESRMSSLEGQIRDLRMQRPIDRQSMDSASDRRLRALETEIVALRAQVHALENRVAELGGRRTPPPLPTKPDEKQ